MHKIYATKLQSPGSLPPLRPCPLAVAMQVPSLVASCLAFFIDNDSDHEGIASTVHHQISASQVTNYCTKDDHCYHNLMVAYNDWRFTVVDTGNFYDANWYHNLLVWFWIQKEVLHEGDTGNSNNANSFPNFETPTMLELLHLVLLAIIWIITISPHFLDMDNVIFLNLV